MFGPDRRFEAFLLRIALPSKSRMLMRMELNPGCAAHLNMSALRNSDKSIGITTSLPSGWTKHAASTYSLGWSICSTIRRPGKTVTPFFSS